MHRVALAAALLVVSGVAYADDGRACRRDICTGRRCKRNVDPSIHVTLDGSAREQNGP